MKIIRVALLFQLIPLLSFSQAPFPSAGEIKQFMQSKTMVVLEDGNSPYNVFIKRAIEEFWTITPFEFIKTADFEDKRKDPAFSFLVLTVTDYEKDKSHSEYNFINLLQGKENVEIDGMPEICAVPLSFAGEDDLEYGYKLGAILSFIQKHARMISLDPSLTGRRYLKYYNTNNPLVATRTILVKQEDLSPLLNSVDKIRALYKNRLEIVPEEEIMKAIREKAPKTLVLHKVGPSADKSTGYCFKMLIGTDDAELYYYNQHLIDKSNPDGLLPADLRRLGKF